MEPAKWAAELPYAKGTLLEGIAPCEEKGSEPPLPQHGWNKAEGHEVYGSALQCSVATYTLSSHH